MNHNSRIELYNNFCKYKNPTNNKNSLHKIKLLGEGVQGKVFQYCTNSHKVCVAIKQMYINKQFSKYIKNMYNPSSLSYEQYIELAANQLTNQLVLQKIVPNFPLNYTYEFEKFTNDYDKAYKSYYYNEFISNSQTLNEWLRTDRTNTLWYNAFFQITTAIYALQKYFNMYHLDLHTYNILVKKIKKGGYWTYNINNKIYKLPNLGYQFYIADFGVAWIPNKIIPWLISDNYIKKKSIFTGFDVYYIFDAILISKPDIPTKFKKDILHLIKELKHNIPFHNAIEHIWFNMYHHIDKNKYKYKLEEYNLDIHLNKSYLPTQLRSLVKY